jgi:hypothetical protein
VGKYTLSQPPLAVARSSPGNRDGSISVDHLQVNKAVAFDLVSVRVAAPFVAPTQVATPGEGNNTFTGSEVVIVVR